MLLVLHVSCQTDEPHWFRHVWQLFGLMADAPGTFARVQFLSSSLRICSASFTSRRKCACFSTPGMPKVLPCMQHHAS